MGTPVSGNAINTFAIDSSQRYSVIARTRCRRILIRENFNSTGPATVDLLQSQPAGGTQAAVMKGATAVYTPTTSDGYFRVGDTVGDIQTVSGSATVAQFESQQV